MCFILQPEIGTVSTSVIKNFRAKKINRVWDAWVEYPTTINGDWTVCITENLDSQYRVIVKGGYAKSALDSRP